MKYICLIIFFLFANIICLEPQKNITVKPYKKYSTDDLLDLVINTAYDNLYGIYDLGNYISKDALKAGTKILKSIFLTHKIPTYIFFIPHLELNSDAQNLKNYTDILAAKIYNEEIIPKNMSAIIVIVGVEDKIMTMKTYNNVSALVDQSDCIAIMRRMNNYFPNKLYSDGLGQLVVLLDYFINNTNFFTRWGKNLMILLLLIWSFVFCCCFAVHINRQRGLQDIPLSMNDEEKLNKIRDFLKNVRKDKKILTDNCIICLEPLNNCQSLKNSILPDMVELEVVRENNISNNANINNPNTDDNKIVTLECGHRFHFQCITEWMMTKNQCPICREKINVDIEDYSYLDESDLQSEIINIQTDIHPVFALLVFESINQEFTWGVSAGNAIVSGWLAGLFGLGAGGFTLV